MQLYYHDKNKDTTVNGTTRYGHVIDKGRYFSAKTLTMDYELFMSIDAQKDSKNVANLKSLQGGCTDGTYFYVLITDSVDGATDQTRVVKIDPATKKVVKVGDIVCLYHANDMTYDPVNKRLVVSWCSYDASKVTFIDPDTLTYKTGNQATSEIEFGIDMFGIAYDPVTGRYAAAGSGYAANGYPIVTFTYDGNKTTKINSFKTAYLGYTGQGIYCDSAYIYYSQSDSWLGLGENIVNIYTWDGEYAGTMMIPLDREIEHIFFWEGSYYIGTQNSTYGRQIWKLTPTEE